DAGAVRQHRLRIAQLVRQRREEAILQLVRARQRLVATLQSVLQLLQIRAVRDNLAEAEQRAVAGANRRDRAQSPEARAIFAYVPALIRGASSTQRRLELQTRNAGGAIFRRENSVQGVTEHVARAEAHDSLRTSVPVDDALLVIHHEDRVV